MPPGYQPAGHGLPGGVPWEGQGGMFSRWWETVSSVNFKGEQFFASSAQSDDAMPAVMFNMTTFSFVGAVLGLIYAAVFAIWSAAIVAALSSGGPGGPSGGGKALAGMAGLGIGAAIAVFVGAVIAWAIWGFLAPWILGGLHHLVLLIFGGVGPNKGYSSTVRAHAYALGAAYAWAMIPGVGGLVALVFTFINHIHGYDATHRCGGGKAFLALIAPFLLCCCCYIAFFVIVAGMSSAVRP
jgi:hypothetical protein